MIEGFFKLLAKKDAFHSCQIEGLYPSSWTFTDYLKHEHDEKQREKRKLKKMNIKKAILYETK